MLWVICTQKWQIGYTLWVICTRKRQIGYTFFWGISGKSMGEGHRNKNIKKQPFGDASASHLSLVLWHV